LGEIADGDSRGGNFSKLLGDVGVRKRISLGIEYPEHPFALKHFFQATNSTSEVLW
jgi:hypothetical protein